MVKVHFILVEPAVPENIGGTARALKTMGFSSLRLVNPANHLDPKAKTLAHGSGEILLNALLFRSLPEALSDIDFSIGTTAKKRRVKQDYHPANRLASIIIAKGKSVSNIGIIFGREGRGLDNKEMALCDLLSIIPMKNRYPSLNLAQAVMLYAYELSSILRPEISSSSGKADPGSLRSLKEKLRILLQYINLGSDSIIYPRIMERTMLLGDEDIHLLHSICNASLEKLNYRSTENPHPEE